MMPSRLYVNGNEFSRRHARDLLAIEENVQPSLWSSSFARNG
jgi:hypothetical protein